MFRDDSRHISAQAYGGGLDTQKLQRGMRIHSNRQDSEAGIIGLGLL